MLTISISPPLSESLEIYVLSIHFNAERHLIYLGAFLLLGCVAPAPALFQHYVMRLNIKKKFAHNWRVSVSTA